MSKIKQAIGISLFESDEFGGPKIVGGGICPTQRANKVCCGVIEVMETEQKIGNIFGFTGGNYAGNVYSKDHLSPTLNTMQGGWKQPMVIDDTQGFEDKPRLYINNAPCLRSERSGLKTIVAMRGRNPTNPSDRTPGIETEQRLEPNMNGTCNTLTSVQKDNLVLEKPNHLGFMDNGTGQHQSNTVYDEKALCPNITTVNGGGTQQIKVATQYRIRKLTPKECWRLMDFSDEDFEKAAEVNSNTQLYKQAGNSIICNVLVAILGQLIEGKEDAYRKV